VARFLEGDEAAFEELVHRYEAAVRKLAFGFVRDWALAEDIAQDTFLKAYRKASSLRRVASVRSWLFRIAINRAQDELRRIKRKKEVSWEAFDVPPVASDQPSAETRAASGELARNLAQALSVIREEHRIPLVLREVDGLTYAEIAKLLGWPLGTVQARLHRGRLELRARLNDLRKSPAAV
jgi:RNA polymerase sigma-70 factor (ECF subfamily)